jgi:glycosyltransferase involved in cell wall biosynthesis
VTKRSVAIIGTRGYPSYYGGFETAIRRLAPYLVEHGWDVTVYGRPGAVAENDPQRDPRVHTIVTHGVESKSLSTLSYGLTAAADAVVRRKPDVALVMNVANGYFLPLLKARGVPTLVNVDGIEWDRAKWGRAAKAMFRGGARMTAKFGTKLVYDARAIEKRWADDFGRDGLFIPYGGSEPGALDVPLDLPSGGYALLVARFVPENTVPEFLRAAEQVAKKYPVVIVGSTGYGGELDDQARALDAREPNVRWLGHVSDDDLLFALLRHAGAYFHGHSVGGTNPALVQAMACSAPVVARDTVYNREVLGDSGTFVEADPSSIAKAVINMIESPDARRRASAAALRRSRQSYTWEIVCAAYEKALRQLVDER